MRQLAATFVLLLFIGCSEHSPGDEGGTAGDDSTGGVGGAATGGKGGTSTTGGSAGAGDSGAGNDSGSEPESTATDVDVHVPDEAGLDGLTTDLDAVSGIDGAGLLELYPAPFATELGYDPSAALRLDEVQASALSLDTGALAILTERGFVIGGQREFPTFVDGYAAIYGEHLPLYVSADSILNAVHRSYDAILEAVERLALIPRVNTMLSGMRASLASGAASELGGTGLSDADVYATVAASLLAGEVLAPVGPGSAASVSELYELAVAADGLKQDFMFLGVRRDIDFSQFEPRGHYTNSEELQRYFRAMTWLGLVDLRLVETVVEDGQVKRLFRRRQLELSYVLRSLLDDEGMAAWSTVDQAVRAFVGEADNMALPELDGLLGDLGVSTPAELSALDDDTIAQTIIDGAYGSQKISGHILKNGTGTEVPLSSVFLLLGKRYVVDSHVFGNVVYDRVPASRGYRMMPSTFDVAFAALANDGAAPLLAPELARVNYAPELAKSRILVDAHPASFWNANLYNDWLSALRALSPTEALPEPSAAGMPAVTGTEAWNRRILNTQLASWAELRHDTLLYAKQSYTGVPACEFPDAYVEPYPEFFGALTRFADHGAMLGASLEVLSDTALGADVVSYFEHLSTTSARLRTLAEHQRNGTAFSAEELTFLNEIVAESENCFFDPGGWYPQLVFGYQTERDTEFDPTIADVHTQPADEGGNIVGKVLHVGTGAARLMVVTVDTCSGPRAYVGLASSYFERVTEDFERLTDEDWALEIADTTPDDVPWMSDLVAR